MEDHDSAPSGTLAAQQLVVTAKRMLTDVICEFELAAPDGAPLPVFTAGAHLVVTTPAGGNRCYSLCNAASERHRYVLAIKREADGRGGSASMIDDCAVGDMLTVSGPQNNFPLVTAPRTLLIAGGIGITPILSMARTLLADGADFHLIYCSRSAATTAFLDVLQAPEFAGHVSVHHDDGDPDQAYDFWDHFEKPDACHIYCCGPAPLMEDVQDMTGHWPAGQIHFEDFGSDVQVTRADDQPFTVRLAQSGQQITVGADQTIVEALRAAGVTVATSCESGTCGTCRTGLRAGQADHRDQVLTPAEQPRQIMICVSRAAGPMLELDL